MTGRRSLRFRLLLFLSSGALSIVLLEAAARAFYYVRWDGELYGLRTQDVSLRLGWRMAPGESPGVHINAQGFRRRAAVPLRPAPDTLRVFLVGGSTAFGFQGLFPAFPSPPLSDEETIDHHLEQALTARHADRAIEVVNAAVPAYRLFQEITLFRERLVNFRPDLVVFLDGHNDLTFLTASGVAQHPSPYWEHPRFAHVERMLNEPGVRGPLLYLDLYLGQVSYFYHGLSMLEDRFRPPRGPARDHPWGDGAFRAANEAELLRRNAARLEEWDRNLQSYVDQVHDLKAIAAARGTNVLYVLQPEILLEEAGDLTPREARIQAAAFRHHRDLGSLAWRYLSPRMAEALTGADAEGFRFLDLVTVAERSSQDVYTDSTHLTPAGNRLVAEQLLPVVEELLDL